MGFSRRAPGFLFCQNFFKILPLYPPRRHGKIVRVTECETGGMGVNRLRKIGAVLLCLGLCLGLFAGCGSDVYIAKLALSGSAGTFDPQFAENKNSILVASNVFEGLLVEDPDGGLHPGVAKGYTVSEDGRTYTFQLREDACWSDGSAVTAQDFVFSFRRLFGTGSTSPYAESFLSVQNAEAILAGEMQPESLGVRAEDDHTLVLTLEKPDSGITTVLAQWYAAPCKESFFTEQKGRYGLEMKSTLYNGPYVISLYDAGKEIRLRQNPNYHSDQPAELYGVNITLGSSDPLAAFAEGDSFYTPVPRESVGTLKKASITEYADTTYALVVNTGRSLLGNEEIRLAICGAIDREGIAGVLPGDQSVTTDLVPETASERTLDYRDTAGHRTALTLSGDARTLFRSGLDAAGEQKLPFTELLVPDTQTDRQAAGIIQGSWQNILGASINVMPLAEDELWQRVYAGDYDMALLPLTDSTAMGLLEDFASDIDRYSTGWQSEEYDTLLDQAAAETGEQAVRTLAQAEQLLLESGVVLPLYTSMSYYAVSTEVQGAWVDPAEGIIYFKYITKS